MKVLSLFASASLAVSNVGGIDPPHLPHFDDYGVTAAAVAHPARVKLVTARDRKYAAALREAAAKPDFAGQYTLASWGCGASCVIVAAIDRVDGSVHWFPATVCCWRLAITEPLQYRSNSRLVIVHGRLNEVGDDGDHRFVLNHGRFAAIP